MARQLIARHDRRLEAGGLCRQVHAAIHALAAQRVKAGKTEQVTSLEGDAPSAGEQRRRPHRAAEEEPGDAQVRAARRGCAGARRPERASRAAKQAPRATPERSAGRSRRPRRGARPDARRRGASFSAKRRSSRLGAEQLRTNAQLPLGCCSKTRFTVWTCGRARDAVAVDLDLRREDVAAGRIDMAVGVDARGGRGSSPVCRRRRRPSRWAGVDRAGHREAALVVQRVVAERAASCPGRRWRSWRVRRGRRRDVAQRRDAVVRGDRHRARRSRSGLGEQRRDAAEDEHADADRRSRATFELRGFASAAGSGDRPATGGGRGAGVARRARARRRLRAAAPLDVARDRLAELLRTRSTARLASATGRRPGGDGTRAGS